MKSTLKGNKIQIIDMNEKFKRDVDKFKEEIISLITQMTSAMLKQGNDIRTSNMKSVEELEKENDTLMSEILHFTNLFESQINQPQKLFASAVSQKAKVNQLLEKLNNIKCKGKVEIYEFKRDKNLKRSVKDMTQLGQIEREEENKQSVEKDLPEASRQQTTTCTTEPLFPSKLQPLLERQLKCRNMTVDRDCLSYANDGSGVVGLYVDKNYMSKGNYFEVEILSLGQNGTIAIGVVPDDYLVTQQLGMGPSSVAFYASGRSYCEAKSCGKIFGSKWKVGDKIGCGITYIASEGSNWLWQIAFTRNGKKIDERKLNYWKTIYPAIGMHSPGEKVKVILNAKMS